MEHIRNFLRGKGFVLALVACILAAAAVGVWAVRTIRNEMEQDLKNQQTEIIPGQETAPGIDEGMEMEEDTWQQETADAAKNVEGVPEEDAKSSPKPSSSSSGASSGSGTVLEPSELQTGSPAASASAGSGYTRPVSGQVLAVWSGDDLVYNETLGDWRTHNGVDYACKESEEVLAPVCGTVEMVATDGNWGPVVVLKDGEGRLWRLCGVDDPAVQEGDAVTTGDKLGQAGSIPCESVLKSHIHLEVLDGDKYLDPVSILKG